MSLDRVASNAPSAVDVLFVFLPVKFGGGRTFGLPPLGIHSLATQLTRNGINARALDASIKGLTLDETLAEIRRHDPKIVGFSAMTPQLRSVRDAVDRLNAEGYRGRIVVGGAHFNDTQSEAFEYLDVDYIFFGESEITFVDFARAFLAGEPTDDVQGMAYKKDGEIRENPARAFVPDLDELPFPDLRLGDPNAYEFIAGRYDKVMTLMASRGCPYTCIFCDEPNIWGRATRLRSAKHVVDEMAWHGEVLGIREFNFKDSTFTLNHKWLERFLDELEARKLDVLWHCHTRIDRVTEPMLKRMKRLGLKTIAFGIESGDQGIIDNIDKKIKVEDVAPVFRMTERLGIQAHAYMMIGHIGETPETAERTVELALRIPATFASFSVNVAYPNTMSYNRAKELGLLSNERWYLDELDEGEAQFLALSADVSPGQLMLPELPPAEQIAVVKKAYRRFYLRPRTAARVLLRFTSLRLIWRAILFAPKFLGFTFSDRPHKPVAAGAHDY